MAGPKIDEIGRWSEVKLDILKRWYSCEMCFRKCGVRIIGEACAC